MRLRVLESSVFRQTLGAKRGEVTADWIKLRKDWLHHFYRLYMLWGHAVAQLVEVLRYKPEGRDFDSR